MITWQHRHRGLTGDWAHTDFDYMLEVWEFLTFDVQTRTWRDLAGWEFRPIGEPVQVAIIEAMATIGECHVS